MNREFLLKRTLVWLIAIFFIGASIIPSTIGNIEKITSFTSFNVRGNVLYVGGSGEGNYTKIQDAIDNSSNGDTVFVYDDSSPYYEYIDVYESIDLIGENKDTTVIHGGCHVSADLVTISGFTIANSDQGIKICSNYNYITDNNIKWNYGTGILIDSSKENTITGNNILENRGLCCNYPGIIINNSSDNFITNNYFTENGAGIVLSSPSCNNTISDNFFSYNYDWGFGGCYGGAIVLWADYNTITDNTIRENCYGIDLSGSNNKIRYNNFSQDGINVKFSDNNTVENNTVNGETLVYLEDESDKIITAAGQVILVKCDNITVKYLNLSNTDVGIQLWRTNNSDINNNVFSKNGFAGIELQYSNRNIIANNKITNNNYGINLNDCSDNNTLYHNNLTQNIWNAYDECKNTWDDGYPSGGNYWDDYTGKDSDGDGIGDKPYDIYGGDNKDRYPLGYFDLEPPRIEITSPEKNYIYVFEVEFMPFITTVIIGKIDITAEARDNQTGTNKIELYIGNDLQYTSSGRYLYWSWGDKAFFRYKIKIIAYDNAGNNATEEMIVWKFF